MADNTLILYTTSDGLPQFILRELGGQLWLTQAEMAGLYPYAVIRYTVYPRHLLGK